MFNKLLHPFRRDFYITPLRLTKRSLQLARKVQIVVYLPPDYYSNRKQNFPLVIFNDGQDFERLSMDQVLKHVYSNTLIRSAIVVGVCADSHRVMEYGTAACQAYNGFGSMANRYTRFIMSELLPYLRSQYRCTSVVEDTIIAGFSLGGLSALDIAWAHSEAFGKVGVFSGSLWWRHTAFREDDPDADRIMFEIIERTEKREGLKFWFQTGTKDEDCDRNNNGVIDAIDDTHDMMRLLHQKGYSDADMFYREVQDGEHNPNTWGAVMPEFLQWALGR